MCILKVYEASYCLLCFPEWEISQDRSGRVGCVSHYRLTALIRANIAVIGSSILCIQRWDLVYPSCLFKSEL